MKRKLNAIWLKRLFNIWPPYLGAGLKVLEITEQWDYARVKLRKGRLNSNYFGTAYGGSLYSMTDPFYALLLVNQLGRDYIVWDKGATIKYIRPGTTDVYCEFKLSPEKVLEIKQLTDQQEKYEPEFEVDIFDANQQLVAKVTKILHVRRKR
ncbi:DUF4442 domain-containing protein [Pleionea litopenaei]|uniref:DUF4442 domain-containing protein n=1 Tax=Pleionea litopenaei TaxID=3070815 RepID=A0AA51RRY4_9GAMM|nr:DUF4442 domain-containing protein [Pleionea sp. HL-JVS1]WMS86435.1 DUF4442 domain-containing protein [Pleionea sp. HL-JVS1]